MVKAKTIIHHGEHGFSEEADYVMPDNPVLQERLDWFQDQKLGFMMHWGPHSLLGMYESWGLSDEDAHWSRKPVDWTNDGEEFKRQYFDLNKAFYPLRFQPEVWAELASESGFKYLLFTTKHHDGFCMWDTRTTDYRVTGEDCPFSTHRYADICRELFHSFRAKGMAISAYFSKADWHTPHYWAPGMERGRQTWRGPSYHPQQYPWLWERFVKFTHDQIMELMTQYGRIDMLWLDAGWVRKDYGEDIRLGEVVEQARKHQPWLLTADRTVGGPYENIITPEQTIPSNPMFVPWESCITLGTGFSYRYEDEYKPTRQLVHTLLEVVAKGGNLALNVAPQPDGRLPKGAISRMKELGDWLKVYGEGIYGTRPCAPYFTGDMAFTRKGNTIYCFKLVTKETWHAESHTISFPLQERICRMSLMGSNSPLDFMMVEGLVQVQLPGHETNGGTPYAQGIRIEVEE